MYSSFPLILSGFLASIYADSPVVYSELKVLMRTYSTFVFVDLCICSVMVGMKSVNRINILMFFSIGIMMPIVVLFGILNLTVLNLGVKGFAIGFGLGEGIMGLLCLIYLYRLDWESVEYEKEENEINEKNEIEKGLLGNEKKNEEAIELI